MKDLDSISILGTKFSVRNPKEAVACFDKWIADRTSRQVCIGNVHTTVLGTEDLDLQRITNSAAMTTMDGKPLVWATALLGIRGWERVAGPDLLETVCRISPSRGYRHFFYGGAEAVPELMRAALETKYPGIQIVGTYSPPFRPLTPEEDRDVVSFINSTKPDFLWVGLGAPKQEKWIYEHLDRIHVPVQIGIGAAFDFFAGTIKRAPEWMQKAGLEWLFRLSQDPRRLWKRYLIYNTKFLLRVIPEIIASRATKGR